MQERKNAGSFQRFPIPPGYGGMRPLLKEEAPGKPKPAQGPGKRSYTEVNDRLLR